MKRAHNNGLDVLGDGIGDFVPFLNVAGKVMGGFMGGGGAGSADAQKAAIEQALQQERARQAAEKARADAERSRMMLYGVLGMAAVGGLLTVMLMRKK